MPETLITEEEGKTPTQEPKPTTPKTGTQLAPVAKFVPKNLDPAPWLYPKIKIPYRQSVYVHRQPWKVCPDIVKNGRYIPPDFQKNRMSYRSDKLTWDNSWLNKIAYISNIQPPVIPYRCEYPGSPRDGPWSMPPVWLCTPALLHNIVMTSVYADGYPPRGRKYGGQMMKPSKMLKYPTDLIQNTTQERDAEVNRGVELCLSGYITLQAFDRYWLSSGGYNEDSGAKRRGDRPIRLDQVQHWNTWSTRFR